MSSGSASQHSDSETQWHIWWHVHSMPQRIVVPRRMHLGSGDNCQAVTVPSAPLDAHTWHIAYHSLVTVIYVFDSPNELFRLLLKNTINHYSTPIDCTYALLLVGLK